MNVHWMKVNFLALDDKRRGLVNKSGFYIQGNILVIDDARMRQHSKIIIKNVIN